MLLQNEPQGQLTLYTCGVYSIKDWYTLFFNPKKQHIDSSPSDKWMPSSSLSSLHQKAGYIDPVHCTQEAVYPLFTGLLLYFLYCLALMLLIRGLLIRCFMHNYGRLALYAGLYILPIMTLVHATFAGVLYYTFPYVVLICSLLGVSVFLSILNYNSNFFKSKIR